MPPLKKCQRRCAIFILIFMIAGGSAQAQDLDLSSYQQSTFSNFALITGRLLGSGLYHTAGLHQLGGIDIGVKVLLGIVPDGNQKGPLTETRTVSMPVYQANIGLGRGFEIGGRFASFQFGDTHKEKVNLASALLKYTILSGVAFPDITLVSAYSSLSRVTDFKLSTLTLGGIIGKSLPIVSVYAGVNYNAIVLDVDIDSNSESLYPEGFSRSYSKNVTHTAFGISLGMAPFTKINIEYNRGELSTVSLGVAFSFF